MLRQSKAQDLHLHPFKDSSFEFLDYRLSRVTPQEDYNLDYVINKGQPLELSKELTWLQQAHNHYSNKLKLEIGR